MDQIKVGFCVAYDWQLLKNALPLVYPHADQICLSIDKGRKSWAGLEFEWDHHAFDRFLHDTDTDHKIRIFEEHFFEAPLTPMQNEVRQRNAMAEFMGGGWHVQLDVDEYFADFGNFVQFLRRRKVARKVNYCCALLTVFKKVRDGYLIIDPVNKSNLEFVPIASGLPHYEHGRKNGYFNKVTPYYLIHQSWARGEDEIRQKVLNWGHRDDFDSGRFINLWKSLDETNYTRAINFHPIAPQQWPALKYISASAIEQLMRLVGPREIPALSEFDLMFRNSLWISRIKSLIGK